MRAKPVSGERARDLVADVITPWVPAGKMQEARLLSAVRRATESLEKTFGAAPANKLNPSQRLLTNPDGSKGWSTTFHYIQRVDAGSEGVCATALLGAWTQLFVDVAGEYGSVSTRGEAIATHAEVTEHGLPAVFWANLFGPHLIESIGKETFDSAPAERRERLEGGSVLLVRDPDPWAWQSGIAKRRSTALRAHIGTEYFARRSWLRGIVPAPKRLSLGAIQLSPLSLYAPKPSELRGDPALLFADPDGRRRELAALLHIPLAELGCGQQVVEAWDETRPWEREPEEQRERWLLPLAFHVGDCVVRALGAKWKVHPELDEPVVELADGRYLRPLVELQDVILDEGRIEEILSRVGALHSKDHTARDGRR